MEKFGIFINLCYIAFFIHKKSKYLHNKSMKRKSSDMHYVKKRFNIGKSEYSSDIAIDYRQTKTVPLKFTKSPSIVLLIIAGALIGAINGFFGGGGGMVCVPVLTMLLKLPEKEAHATTLLIMLPLCICSLITYFITNTFVWQQVGVIALAFVVGGVLGAILLKKLNNVVVGFIFAGIVIVAGVKLLFF